MSEHNDFQDSGPFCQHWGDPSDCDEVCAGCGHFCHQHQSDACNAPNCPCPAFQDATYT